MSLEGNPPATAAAPIAAPAAAPEVIATISKPPEAANPEVADLRAGALEILTKAMNKPDVDPAAPLQAPANPPAADPKAPVAEPAPAENDPAARLRASINEAATAQEKVRLEREALRKEREGDPASKALEAAKASRDPVAALEALGFTWDEAVEALVSKPKGGKEQPTTRRERELLDRLERAEKKVEEISGNFTQQRELAEKAADIRTIGQAIDAGGEKYELLKAVGPQAAEMVYAATVGHFKKTGQWLGGSPGAALEVAMGHAHQQYEQLADGLLKTGWAKRKLAPVGAKPEAVRPPANPGQTPTAPRTLTNSQVAASPPRPANQPPSKSELRAGALEILEKAMTPDQAGS